MNYTPIDRLAREDAQRALASGDPEVISKALVQLAFHDPDRGFVESVLASQLQSPDPWIRGIAATCVGHVARIHRALDTERLLPLLLNLRSDARTVGNMQDALDDIRIFTAAKP